MGKPFFYKINAAELMSEVFQIPPGKHEEWLRQFVVDLVAAEGTTPYTKKLIAEVEEYRKRQAESGSKGGKNKRRKHQVKSSDPQATLEQPFSEGEATLKAAQGRSISSSTNYNHPKESVIEEECGLDVNESFNGRRVYEDGTGRVWDVDTGEELNPFGGN